MRTPDSPPSSPARKRRRLSSPLYEGSIDSLSQEELAVVAALEAKFSYSQSGSSQPLDNSRNRTATLEASGIPGRLADDAENPFASTGVMSGFTSASSLRVMPRAPVGDNLRQSNDHTPSELHDSDWLKPASIMHFPGFQAASSAGGSEGKSPAAGFMSAGVGFTTAGKKSTYAPSKAALAAAQAKIEAIWNEEEDQQDAPANSPSETPANVFIAPKSLTLSSRPALRALENAFNSPRTPLQAGQGSRIPEATPFSPLIERSKDKGKGKARDFEGAENIDYKSSDTYHSTPSNLSRSRQFKSPLVTHQIHTLPAADKPSQNKPDAAFRSAVSQLPASQRHFVTPRRVLPAIARASGSVKPPSTGGLRTGVFKPINRPFITPLKPGTRSENSEAISAHKNPPGSTPLAGTTHLKVSNVYSPRDIDRYPCFFDLSPQANRMTLMSSGLLPQQFEPEDLDTSLRELTQIIPSSAPYYAFHLSSGDVSIEKLGPSAALGEMKKRGCVLATKPWVDNHWCLILWKLSGMALMNPDQEKDPVNRRWSWSAVMRQLLYRYERELNQGKRPPLRLITTRDAPAALPLVLCVSNIFWPERAYAQDGLAIDQIPELELTDGWYRLRAVVDPPMARAIRRGVIRIGRKIGVAGARLSSEKKEPSEILEAYNSSKLVLSGNSSHLMPWHAKLGFQRGPIICTLHSLTADGGCVVALDIVITKIFPIAFFEFIGEDGKKHRQGPRSEAEEAKLHDSWKMKREREASKLRHEFDKRLHRFEGYIDRLESRAGVQFNPSDDQSPPSNIDDLYDLLEDPREANALIARLDPIEAGWLARHAHASINRERESGGHGIEGELQKLCPPRDVRDFRVIVVQDACTRRRPANRIAQITAWNVLGLCVEEGSSKGAFGVGQRYIVTNLIATQQSAWMNCDPGSQVFLSTRRDSRWMRLQ